MSTGLLIVAGPRGLLSLAGIVLIVGGVWHADRKWDEEGSKAYERAAAAAADATPQPPDKEDTLSTVLIPQDELNAAFPLPIAFLLGWLLFAISYFAPIDGSNDFFFSGPALASALISLSLGWVASVPMGDAVQNRNAKKKMVLSVLFLLLWIGLAIVSGWGELTAIHGVFRAIGVVSIVASMKGT